MGRLRGGSVSGVGSTADCGNSGEGSRVYIKKQTYKRVHIHTYILRHSLSGHTKDENKYFLRIVEHSTSEKESPRYFLHP